MGNAWLVGRDCPAKSYLATLTKRIAPVVVGVLKLLGDGKDICSQPYISESASRPVRGNL